jgi:protoheme IX farnesyltransferase
MSQVLDLFKLRIGAAIALAALAGLAVTPGPPLAGWQVAMLAAAVLVSSAAAGAYNQYAEADLDRRMQRTRARPFVTGALARHPAWLWLIAAMSAASVLAAAFAANALAALYVFLGAFTYGVVYTVWLKRRTPWNIVIGGLAGSFAVLAGAAAVSPAMSPEALWLAVALFFWTPPHFWSLAIAYREDYARAGVPMLPVVAGDERSARVILASAVPLVGATLAPAAYGLGGLYLAAAAAGGAYFLASTWALVRAPGRAAALASFRASLVQLALVLVGAIADSALRG